MKRRRANTLVALSSAAVMTVYAAGFMRTRAAAEKLENSSRSRPPVVPAPASMTPPAAIAKPVAVAKAVVPPTKVDAPKVIAPKAAVAAKVETSSPKPEAGAVPVAVAPAVPVLAEVTPAAPVASAPATPAPELSPSAEVLLGGTELHNGTFLGWGTSRHGDIQASVTIYSGRITAVSIAQCRTRYSCDIIAHMPAKVLKDQTPEKLNNVSGATQSVDAFYFAVMDAINKAK